jgi:hypothetical protein
VQTVAGGINYNFSDEKQQACKLLWMDYQSKLSPEMEMVYVVSDSQIIQSQTTIVGQIEGDRSLSVPRILNHYH